MTSDTNFGMVSVKKVPPDGGWGWLIVLALALNNLTTIPVIQGFGLIFKEELAILNLSSVSISFIINSNVAFGMIMSLFNGPLLRDYGYRRIAIVGSILYSTGVTLTAFANNFTYIVITYSLMASLGMGLTASAFSLALNSYFTKRRERAMGLAMTITGLGPILMPQAVSYSLDSYGIQNTMLLCGAYTTHSIIGAFLLQPIKWHMKKAFNDEEVLHLTAENEESIENLHASIDSDLKKGKISLMSANSMDTVHLGSSLRLFDEMTVYEITDKRNGCHDLYEGDGKTINDQLSLNGDLVKNKKPPSVSRLFHRFVVFYGLDLLSDPIYVNIILGLSIAIFAELNFSITTPFILGSMGMSTEQIANVMSVLAITDLVFRGLAPYIGELLRQPPRIMYMFSLFLLIISRSTLLFVESYMSILCVSVGLGLAKGIRSVYMSLVLPSYVPIEKLAYASSIQMIVNGILLMFGGPLIGKIRDITGNYNACIVIINCLTSLTLIIWIIEMIIVRSNERRKKYDEKLNINIPKA